MLATIKVKRGFSLTEILVSLAIIAIMGAVLVPMVNSQLGKSDAARAASDLTAIQVAVQSFMGDIHRVPKNTTQLITKITTSDSDLGNPNTSPPASSAAFADYLVANWRGPYLNKGAIGPTSVGNIQDNFSVTTVGTSYYLTVTMTNVAPQDFAQIEGMLDEGSATSTSSTLGSVRYSGTMLSFLAVPIL